jgi:pre-60S factor REI1
MDQDSIFCNACQLTVSLQEKNAHYGTEWHRYNVKRKCASLPPVPRALFESKVAAFQQTTAPVSTAETILKCKPCKFVVFYSEFVDLR